MRFSLDWLRELVAIDLDPKALASRLSLFGFAVDAVETFAPPSDPVGPPDTVLDVDVPSNRPDAMNHLGLAREIAAITGAGLKAPVVSLTETSTPASSAASVTIEAPDLCPRYVVRVVRGVRIVDSPRWMKRRLEAIGVPPKNAVVDALSTYVLFGLGQPLHAFDLARLAGRGVVVRRARAGETIVTVVDRAEKTLGGEMLVIGERGGSQGAGRAAAIAGVMGGLDTAISDSTTEVLIESAWFDPLSVRHTARALELRTDASHRFERGADPAMTRFAADRLAGLYAELAGGEVLAGAIDARGGPEAAGGPAAGPRGSASRGPGNAPASRSGDRSSLSITTMRYAPIFEPPLEAPPSPATERPGAAESRSKIELPVVLRDPLLVRRDRIDALLGVEMDARDVAPTLARAGVQAFPAAGAESPRPGSWRVHPPSWRWDLAREVDLIEELARLSDYERIPETLPAGAAPVPCPSDSDLEDRARDLLVSFGYHEAINYAMIPSADDDLFGAYDALTRSADDRILITNPLSERWEVMRRSLLSGLARTASFNLARGRHDLRLFEVASVHAMEDGRRPVERRAAAIVGCGLAADPSWPVAARAYDVLDLKGAIEALASGLAGAGQDAASGAATPLEGDGLFSGGAGEAHPSRASGTTSLIFELPPSSAGPGAGPFHPGQSFAIRLAGRIVGRGGRLHPDVEAALESERPVYAAEILLDPFLERLRTPRYDALPRLNPVERDLSFFVDAGLPYASVARSVASAITEEPVRVAGSRGDAAAGSVASKGAAGGDDASGTGSEVVRPRFFLLDRFEGKSVPAGKVSYALRFRFAPRTRALTADELNGAIERIAGRLNRELGAEIRSR